MSILPPTLETVQKIPPLLLGTGPGSQQCRLGPQTHGNWTFRLFWTPPVDSSAGQHRLPVRASRSDRVQQSPSSPSWAFVPLRPSRRLL